MSRTASQPAQNTMRSLIVATAGHVDHGKTSLVRALTGVDTDTLDEEKSRGLTINLGFAYSQEYLPDSRARCTLGFVDVPGHKDFINNMLAGVGTVQAALLVVAADDGIMPQTREHLRILDLLGIKQAVIAISKCDVCEPEQRETLRNGLKKLLVGSALADAPVIETSSKSNTGIEQVRAQLLSFAASMSPLQAHNRYFRFQVDRSFSVKGIGTVVTGTALSGESSQNELLSQGHSGKQFRIRGIRLHENDRDRVDTGERAALNLASATQSELRRGDWLHHPWLRHPVYRVDVALNWLPELLPSSGAQYHLHIGSAHHLVSLRALAGKTSPWFQIRSPLALSVHFGDRFIIRDPTGTQTVGGGHVVDIMVPRKHRSSSDRLAMLKAMDQSDTAAFTDLVQLAANGIDLEQFRLTRNLTQQGLEEILSSTREAGIQIFIIHTRMNHSIAFSRNRFELLSKQLLQIIRDYHNRHPSESGIATPQLSKSVAFAAPFPVLQAVVEKLATLKLITQKGNLFHLPSHIPRVSNEEKQLNTLIRPLLENAGKIPPRTRELAESTGLALDELEGILKIATRSGQLIKVADNRYYLPETIFELAEFTEQLAMQNGEDEGFTVIQFRDASGIGRNLCIEILEYFDNCGFTRRDGNTRFLRTNKANLFS